MRSRFAFTLLVTLSMASSASAATWECKAAGIQNYTYKGGDSAYIHLAGFPRGSDYPVVVSKDGKKATGTTKNGTPFTCTKKG